jgi:hypothetical protein
MKKIISVIMLSGVLFITSCSSKQTTTTGVKDLTGKIEKMQLKDGETEIEKVKGSLSLYAKAEKGEISAYVVKDSKTGKEYTPSGGEQEPEDVARMRAPGGRRFCRIRFILDGQIVEWTVPCWRIGIPPIIR